MSRGASAVLVAGVAVAACIAAIAGVSRADERSADQPLEFVRVIVPAERLRDVPLEAGRLVPMPLADFDRAVAAVAVGQASSGPRPLASEARYRLAIDGRGSLAGGLEFDIDAGAAGLGGWVSLGAVHAERAMLRAARGVGEAVLYGVDGGRVAIRTPVAGAYACGLAVAPLADATFSLPLVAAVTTRIELQVPESMRPVCSAGLVTPPTAAGGAWRIDLVGAESVALSIVPTTALQPRVRCWTNVVIRGPQIDVAVRVVPEGPWRSGGIALRKTPGLVLVQGGMDDGTGVDLGDAVDDAQFVVDLPAGLEGTTTPLDLRGVGQAVVGAPLAVPSIRPTAERWAGGGLTLTVDPAFVVAALDVDECVVVAPSAAARWPAARAPTAAGTGAEVHLEQQSATARATVTIARRVPRLDTARVTTLEVSPGAVLGRAACEVRVDSGEAFAVGGRVAPEWFIDSVEQIDLAATADPGRADGGAEPRPRPASHRGIDWRVVRAGDGSELRIALATAATPDRPLGLRITGHRRGVPIGGEFQVADLDMVRLDGETADTTLVDYRVGSDSVVERAGRPLGIIPATGRCAALAEPGTSRGRIHGGDDGVASLVRRRPPLQADTLVQLVARDSRITESLSFTCRPESGALDSVVVTVSEPLGDAVEWSLVEPGTGVVVARRLEAAGEGRGAAGVSTRESWLVEFRPAVTSTATFRATRTQPFAAAAAVPLAWIDGATGSRGTVVIRGAGGTRPGVVNRGLRERPPVADERSAAVVTELSFDAADVLSSPGAVSAVMVVPPDTAESRAWVWREMTTACCHDAGWIECETDFDIENRGRSEVTLSVPPGMRLDEVSIDNETVSIEGGAEAGGTARVVLPAGRGRMRLRVRGVVARDPTWGAWRIDPIACSIDVPRLDGVLRLKVPAAIDLLLPGGRAADELDWGERLFDAISWVDDRREETPATEAGFRIVEVPARMAGGIGVYAVRRRLVATAAIVAAGLMAAVTWWLGRHRGRVAVAIAVAAALAALWAPTPLATVARAAWWGGLAGLCASAMPAGGRRLVAQLAAVAGVTFALPAAAADSPPRVYVAPADDGGTALVPETLFRRLTTSVPGRESVRVRHSRLVVGPHSPWRLELDVDADQGGVLDLDQTGADVRWVRPVVAVAAVTVDVQRDGLLARVVVATAGLHRVAIELTPRPVATGGVERVVVRLPAAAEAEVSATANPGAETTAPWQCDRADAAGAWRPGGVVGDAADMSRTERVRLVRSIDERRPLLATPVAATSVNDVWWGEDACVVNATFDIDQAGGVVRSVVIAADRSLKPVENAAGQTLVPLGPGRYLVDIPDPTPGPLRLTATFAMALTDPTGIFDVPDAWIEATSTEARTVRCAAAAGLDVTPELPAGYSLLRTRDGDAPEVTAAWRSEHVTSGDALAEQGARTVAERPRPRVAVRRRPVPPRLVQRLEASFAMDEVAVAFDCQIDSRSSPFTGVTLEVPAEAAVERVAVVDEGGSAGVVDVHVSRPAPTRLLVVAQRPRTGIFRLTLAAHVAGAGDGGRMPLVRCIVADGSPLAVRWRSRDGTRVRFETSESQDVTAGTDAFEIAAGGAAPTFTRSPADAVDDRPVESPLDDVAAVTDVAADRGVEGTTIHLVIDRTGRLWGLARFEVVATEPVVRLRLPSGLRLFDVLVDGRETRATAVEPGAWDVRLQDVGWPRSLLAVFAGEGGGAVDAAGAIRIEPPRIDGLPCREVLWTIDAPADVRLRVADPGQVVATAEWRRLQAVLRGRVAAAFAAAADRAAEPDRERLVAFARARERGGRTALESEWEQAVKGPAEAGAMRSHVAGAGDDGITIRLSRRVAAGSGGRGVATIVLLGGLAATWCAAAQWPAACAMAVARGWPWLIAAGGAAWVILLRPMLPGWAMLAIGAAVLVARRRWSAEGSPPT